jgi:hypothetical protein
MNYIAQIPLKEWAAKYSDHLGFAFVSGARHSPESVNRLVQSIISAGASDSEPIIVSIFDGFTLFAYDSLDGPNFFRSAAFFEQAVPVARIMPLKEFFVEYRDQLTKSHNEPADAK